VIFSAGAGMSSFFYTTIIEDLASHGYIVAAVEHPFESNAVVFPNGRVMKYDEGQVKDVLKFTRARIEVRAADVSFVINELARMNRNVGMFRGRIDLARVGVLGHSRGGLAAATACQRDARIKACLNMDGGTLGGPFYPPANNANMKSAFMWFVRFKPEPSDAQLQDWKMTRQQWEQNKDRSESRVNGYFGKIDSNSYRVTLYGASHQTFSDLPLVSSEVDLQTAASRFRLIRTVRAYVLAFFKRTLRGDNSDLLNGASSDYPEVTIERFGPQ
jgi:alpha-beta hydrolase superfamily lysophospholipase